ncbi:hypothetical protein K7432_003161 [Basidiobolus ranarum]|uniref:TauD/TfdA-like domain-containing protein n=1 Tax=Basidiobolus ranarum TaxID=34480 RepID=A0ABR2X0B6_9FUNG
MTTQGHSATSVTTANSGLAIKGEYIQGFNAHADHKNLLDAVTKRTDLTPSIGTELEGVQLAELTDSQLEDLLSLAAERGVVFFRDQNLNQEDSLKLGSKLGPLHVHPFISSPDGKPQLLIPDATGRRQAYDETINRNGGWHTDISFEETPASISILQLKKVPPTGGDTLWSNAYALYDKLSPEFQKFLEKLTGIHSGEGFIKLSELSGRPLVRPVPTNTEHPVIRTNPITKQKALFVNPTFTKSIKELNPTESDLVLKLLFNHVTNNHDAQVRFSWTPNSVAVWDNRSTQHIATPDYYPYERYGERVTVLGEKPYFDPESTTEAEVNAPKIAALLKQLELEQSQVA